MTDALEFHPLADAFPLIEGAEFEGLVADICAQGLHEPIVRYQGKILDGRNRYRACEKANVEARFEDYNGDDPLSLVISLNLKRRHLNESQRAMVAAKLATLRQGARTDLSPIGEMSQGQAAALLNVGKRSVERAADVRDRGAPELVRAVEQGSIAVSLAAKLLARSSSDQAAIVKRVVEDGERPLEAARQIKIARIAAREPEEFAGRYRVLYADPPWRYGSNSFIDGVTTQATDHYPCLSLEEICAIPVQGFAEDNAVLFLWVTSPFLEHVFKVIKAWGFEYKATFVWDNVKHNIGHYNSVRHEFLLICTRGSCTPDNVKLFDSVQSIERSDDHSEKPERFYEIIEQLYPHGNRIELFARGAARPGWAVWGNQADEKEAA